MADVVSIAEEGSPYSLLMGLEGPVGRIDDLARAAEALVTEMGRDDPAGPLCTLLELIREAVKDHNREWEKARTAIARAA